LSLILPWENIGQERGAWCAPTIDPNWTYPMWHAKKSNNPKRSRACSPRKFWTATTFAAHASLCVFATAADCRSDSHRDGDCGCGFHRRWRRHQWPTLTQWLARRWWLEEGNDDVGFRLSLKVRKRTAKGFII